MGFTYSEVSAEYKLLGFTWPKDEDFASWEITDQVAQLTDYHLTTDVTTLTGDKFPAKVVTAFGRLAEALGTSHTVKVTAYDMRIVRAATNEELRERALSQLKSNRDTEQRQIAEQSLERKAKADGE